VFHLKPNLRRPATDPGSEPALARRSQVVDLGVLTLDTPVDTLRRRKNCCSANRLTDGIELSDDRLPVIRSRSTCFAFARRAR